MNMNQWLFTYYLQEYFKFVFIYYLGRPFVRMLVCLYKVMLKFSLTASVDGVIHYKTQGIYCDILYCEINGQVQRNCRHFNNVCDPLSSNCVLVLCLIISQVLDTSKE